jgi:hypothetical protein
VLANDHDVRSTCCGVSRLETAANVMIVAAYESPYGYVRRVLKRPLPFWLAVVAVALQLVASGLSFVLGLIAPDAWVKVLVAAASAIYVIMASVGERWLGWSA